jgi:hypothetical protein
MEVYEEESSFPVSEQWDEAYLSTGNKRRCGICHQMKKVSEFPMSFALTRKSSCRFCVLAKKTDLHGTPHRVVSASEELLSNAANDDAISNTSGEDGGSASFQQDSTPFSNCIVGKQSTPTSLTKSLRRRLSLTTPTPSSAPPMAPIMTTYALCAGYA